MAIQELKFTKDWNNAEDFPVVAKDAAQARANIQQLHDETKDYINEELVPAVQDAGNISKHCWRVRDFDMVTGIAGDIWRYIYSEDRNAYPDSGIVDGFEYDYLGIPADFATPPGGRSGQVLAKASDADHDYMWADLPEAVVVPGGGGEGEGGGTVVEVTGVVRYNISQALTASQKAIARSNIGAASQSLSVTVEGLGSEVEGLKSTVADSSGKITQLEQTVEEIRAGAGDGDGDVSELTIRVDEIEGRVQTAEGDIGKLEIQAQEIVQRVESAEGEVASFSTRADGIEARVSDNEEEIGQLDLTAKSFETRIAETEDGVAENASKYSEIKQTVDDISFTVSDPINGGTNRYVTITLTVGDNAYTGVVMIDGNVDVSGQLSAEALYATLGDIARLKVDSLSTSRRIPMYLARDTSDDNYIDIQEQHITLRRAWTDGSTEQARDDFGAKLYWEQDIEDATLGSDGYPYVDGARVFVTTEITDWPVMVYSYEEGDRLRTYFDEDNNYGPRQVWGEGDGTSSGKGRGYIEKPGLSFDIYNLGTDGVKRGIFMNNDFTDIVGQRRPTKIAFSGDVCNITLEGGISMALTFNRDSSGAIVSVTDSTGHTCTLEGLE